MNLQQFKLTEYSKEIKSDVIFENDMIIIKSDEDKYTVSKITSDIFEIDNNSVYKFNADYSGENYNIKFILNLLNEKGKSILRFYANSGSEIRIPADAQKAYFEIIVFSFGKFKAEIKGYEFEFQRKPEKKQTVLAAIHIDSDQDVETTPEENMRKALYGIDKASKVNPDLVVLTERFYDRRVWKSNQETAITMDSEPISQLKNKAKDYKCYIAASLNIIEDGKYYNRGILIDRRGEIAGTYDKTHLTMSEIEKGVVPGEKPVVFDTDFGKVAFAICWDLWFPKLINKYMKMGVKVLINPTGGFPDVQMRARAIDNGMYIVSPSIMSRVRTRIINPLGEVISNAEVNGYAYASVDLEEPMYEYWLSVGDSYSEGRNVYINEEREDI